jgi:hypothetical protein
LLVARPNGRQLLGQDLHGNASRRRRKPLAQFILQSPPRHRVGQSAE